jgi:hypothetical protein
VKRPLASEATPTWKALEIQTPKIDKQKPMMILAEDTKKIQAK